ncbi:MAG: esterase family protein [Chitinophagaceae bacterium]|nr:esterase family protein [Chitinophagaceae bacterium]
MRILSLLLFALFLQLSGQAAIVDTVSIPSKAMGKTFKCVVIMPDNYAKDTDKSKRYPVVYLLHGYGGWYSNYVTRLPEIVKYADQFQFIIVTPEGKDSWYLDSPVDDSMKFETYVGTEIPAWIDTHYTTISDRKGRAITGLSMGGHGGLYLGWRHADLFGACGSMSGGVYLRPFPKNWQLMKRLGDTLSKAENWEKYSVLNVIEEKPKDSLAIIIDCGTEDFFYDVNNRLHAKMEKLKIPHDYITRPGAHNWDYWRNALQYQFLFFSNYFNRVKGK